MENTAEERKESVDRMKLWDYKKKLQGKEKRTQTDVEIYDNSDRGSERYRTVLENSLR